MPAALERLSIRRPDDWHLHLRDGPALATVVGATARVFGRAVVMPNLRPPVTTVAAALAYRDRIVAAAGSGTRFTPLMTLYLTDATTPDEIARARASGAIVAVKAYPAGATTNSDAGIRSLDAVRGTIEAIEKHGLVLSLHGEVTDPDVDIYDRERVFVERELIPLVRDFPGLRIVLEHVTTREAVQYVADAPPTVAATITPQHLLWSRNAMLVGGIRPHLYCLPILKRDLHRRSLVEAATSGSSRFFLGTDSAPHARDTKEHACGCAGCFSAPVAMELYAEAFDTAGALDRLEGFASLHGAAFYGLPVHDETITLVREPWQVPAGYPYGDGTIVPLRAGEAVGWRIA